MTTNVARTYSREPSSVASEPEGLTLTGEHALLLRGVHRRVWPVLALIDAGAWPTAELHTLVDYLRASLVRQASDEEALHLPGGAATPFADATAQHAGLRSLTERLAQADMAHCSPPELRRMVAELLKVVARHLEMEQDLAVGLAETSHPVPSAAELASGAQTWLQHSTRRY